MKLSPQTKHDCMILSLMAIMAIIFMSLGSWLTMQYYTNKYKEIISTHKKMELK